MVSDALIDGTKNGRVGGGVDAQHKRQETHTQSKHASNTTRTDSGGRKEGSSGNLEDLHRLFVVVVVKLDENDVHSTVRSNL
jgi:hypothetical protein